MILINGVNASSVAVTDRAMQYGDGCFTTMLVEQGMIRLWPFHLARLQTALERLAIAAPDWPALTDTVHQLAADLCATSAAPKKAGIKILISRGSGGRGYSPTGCSDTQVVISTFAWPIHYTQWQQNGIALGVCQQQLAKAPMLAGLKHLNRLEQVMLKREVEAQGWLDALVCDVDGQVIETVASNLFWRQGDQVFTPELTMSGVEGVMRRHVIELLEAMGYHTRLVNAPIASVLAADEVFITNALMALVPINEIHGVTFTERHMLSELNKRLYTC
ncbi:aminodeoxychorismate lyase [Photobacterium aphoticum]|uniref:Aminodeoxychorismate lyase n=1 Tax=Photobacterium aphoticum TaxID=754436 RepID=A0A0J1GU87_9GAMM|nr:aminodeoxychorismate lyase [Photobacterium aphoticum]KLV02994.1 4-amino-4-deoxychorismate lyase [Photobacterium aphoticum]PSU57889.1 aminodeoxychorismate lyase [Photobacterium aphoticum]GHA60319.1 aminodeoxychorismate lyase [Photobacterium aphoticum]